MAEFGPTPNFGMSGFEPTTRGHTRSYKQVKLGGDEDGGPIACS